MWLAFLVECDRRRTRSRRADLGPATGASFNPARWFGPSLASVHWDNAWLYILAPIVGAVGATFTYLAVMRLGEPPLPTQSARRCESAEPPVAV